MCCYGGEQIRGTSHSLLVERAMLPVALGGYEDIPPRAIYQRVGMQSILKERGKEITAKRYEEWAKGLWRKLFG